MMTETKLSGLRPDEVAERTARGQVNRVRRSDRAEYLDIAARNVLTLFNGLVVLAALALFALAEYRGALAVSGMAVTNAVLGLVQEVRAKWHLDRLALLTETRARVVRGGQVGDVPSGDVVLGDHLLLAAGEPVVADGDVLEARFLEVDEALLTGESDPVPRRPGEPLLSGSFCVAGEGCYRADRVGAEAFAQRTAAEARAYRYAASPLQESIDRLIRILTWTAVTLCAGYVVLYQVRGFSRADLVEMIAATLTSMVPQGLVLMTTLAFTLGAVRMSRRGALVQHLNAVESMAGIDTLCLDKTGTLTTNNLRLERLEGVDPSVADEEVRARLRLFASASLDRASKSLAALRAALGEGQAELLDQLPFKSQNRYSAVRVRGPRQPAGRDEYVLVLGACEALRPFLAPEKTRAWEKAWSELLGTGLRLLLFAEAAAGRPQFDGSLEGFVLRPLALVALSDELRPEAGAVLRALAEQGIGFKVLSGDNPETVRATVAPLGAGAVPAALRALAEGPVVTGAELEKSAHAAELIRTRAVFGRVSPWQKVEVVRTLRAQGRHVAMVGDGVNDVLPLKNAHLGIAMGEGSRASKTVSGLVLETNDFGLLPETLEEGRTILRNLRRAGKLFLTKNAYTLLLIVGALGVFHLPFPFLPQQVTLLNVLTIGVPAFVITLSRERSAAPARPGFVREVGGFALRTGAVIGAAGLLAMLLAPRWAEVPPRTAAVTGASTAGLLGSPAGPGPLVAASVVLAEGTARQVQTQRTVLLSVLVLLGLTTLLRLLTDGEVGRRPGDRKFVGLALAAVPVYLAALYWPPAAYFFELTPLTGGQWGRVLAVVAAAYGVLWASDRLPAGPPRPLGPR
jgi:cation-transporting ATPase E